MKNIVFVAPPAAGKGTQAKIICEKHNYEHISTGDLLRVEAVENVSLKEQMARGEFISDDIIIDLIIRKINSLKDVNGCILDGFPRNISQAIAYDKILEENNQSINNVIYIDVDKETAKKRIVGRIYCPNCGAVYNDSIEENMPQTENICDKCSSTLVKRADDNAETFEKRFDIYMQATEPLLSYYEDRGTLYKVNGNLDFMSVNKEIEDILGSES